MEEVDDDNIANKCDEQQNKKIEENIYYEPLKSMVTCFWSVLLNAVDSVCLFNSGYFFSSRFLSRNAVGYLNKNDAQRERKKNPVLILSFSIEKLTFVIVLTLLARTNAQKTRPHFIVTMVMDL